MRNNQPPVTVVDNEKFLEPEWCTVRGRYRWVPGTIRDIGTVVTSNSVLEVWVVRVT